MRECNVDHEFDQFKWCHFGADIARVANAVADYGDASSIWVNFFRADFADDKYVADFFEMIRRYAGNVNDMKGIGAINWVSWGIFVSEILAEMSKFFGIGGASELLIIWMFDELPIFKGSTCVVIQNYGSIKGIGGWAGTGGLCDIGKHDKVDTGIAIVGCCNSTRTSAECNGFSKARGYRERQWSCAGQDGVRAKIRDLNLRRQQCFRYPWSSGGDHSWSWCRGLEGTTLGDKVGVLRVEERDPSLELV